MKKIIFILVILPVIIFLFSAETTYATIGGPLTISQIVYDANNNAVYYVTQNEDQLYKESGCSAMINRIDLKTNEESTLNPCSAQTPKCYETNRCEAEKRNYINNTFRNFEYLQPVNLSKNNFAFDVKVINEKKETKNDLAAWAELKMAVMQDNTKKAEIEFSTCSSEQPSVVRGYSVPDTDMMILLLISSRNEFCSEGGYTNESLYVLKGIKYYDTTFSRFGINVDLGSDDMVIYAQKGITDGTLNSCPQLSTNTEIQSNYFKSFWKNKTNLIFLVSALLLGIIIGLSIGFLIKKKRATLPEMSDQSQ